MWRRADGYIDVVESAWCRNGEGPNPIHSTWANLKSLSISLKEWSHETFGSVRGQIQKLEKKLWYLRNSRVCEAIITEEKLVEGQLCELFKREEIMARQHSRVEWLQEGD